MKVLVTAPHPFYQERGTPIAVDLLVRALSERGDHVDVLTFHEGEERCYPGMRIFRIAAPPGASNVRPGPSLKKIICDLWLFWALFRRLRRERYDLIHCVEESVFMAMVLKPFLGTPFIYDMDSSLVTQIINKYRVLAPLERWLRKIESLPFRRAEAVVPVCDALADQVAAHAVEKITILRDVSLLQPDEPELPGEEVRQSLGIEGSISMYVGNLESYQGIDLLLNSFALVSEQDTNAHLVIIGGDDADIGHYQARVEQLGVSGRVHFLGKRPLATMGAFLRQADVLISPRSEGVNTPMKVYSYLHSGVAVLATDLPTHTQVMTSAIARLAPPEPIAFTADWLDLLARPAERAALGARARKYVERNHSYESFRRTLHGLYADLEQHLHGGASAQQHQHW